ncbi:hypothetical protein CYY_000077 [Polysphondylium violaceum]|uniref:Carbohydrate kinase PfkB domain-containing protein n=1 Tax=Polysphondylium violaceum TaxID=133409 RepID=A0A8J4Q4H8_9MYCE|nr:hypothetical protein CYY_000077 [Polysphondylium violaceum]
MKKIVFIGNFVNDVILIHQDLILHKEKSFSDLMDAEKQKELNRNGGEPGKVTKADALGGSVTYGSLAATEFGDTISYIVTTVGGDINHQFNSLIQNKQPHIDLSFIENDTQLKNTSYYLNYYNNKKNRTLSLMEKGKDIDAQKAIHCITTVRPDAILFVPVSGELDEELVVSVLESIKQINSSTAAEDAYLPVIAFDIQGFLRAFNGTKVITRPKHIMIQKLISISQALRDMDIISVVKAEYGEAAAIMGDHDPATCAKLLRSNFGFTISSVTMGGDGGFVSSDQTQEVYIPTFKPDTVCDETGCGDTFLTCTVLELLNVKSISPSIVSNNPNMVENKESQIKSPTKLDNNTMATESQPTEFDQQGTFKLSPLKNSLSKKEILHCLEVGSAGASFLVEKMGPNGFADRNKILERVEKGKKQIKKHYQPFLCNSSTVQPDKDLDKTSPVEFISFPNQSQPKKVKTTTHYI